MTTKDEIVIEDSDIDMSDVTLGFRELVVKTIAVCDLDGTIEELKRYFDNIVEAVERDGGIDPRVDVSQYYDNIELDVYAKFPETQRDFKTRYNRTLSNRKNALKKSMKKAESERKLYERLKKKYE